MSDGLDFRHAYNLLYTSECRIFAYYFLLFQFHGAFMIFFKNVSTLSSTWMM